MIINRWPKAFARLYGSTWPNTYCTIDTEYTGPNAEKDVICEIGHTLVREGEVVDQLSLVLNWANHPVVPDAWVRDALERIRARMALDGSRWRLDYETMQKEGVQPEKALAFYHKFFTTIQGQKIPFVAHNGYSADERMLIGHFEGFLGKKFRFGENGMIDTGAIVKASKILQQDEARLEQEQHIWLPQPQDTLESYFRRVTGTPARGIFWKLTLCVDEFELQKHYPLDTSLAHTAGYDSFVVHLLMEEFRRRITVNHGDEEENPWASPSSLDRAFHRELAKGRERKEENVKADQAAEVDPPRQSRRVRGQRKV